MMVFIQLFYRNYRMDNSGFFMKNKARLNKTYTKVF